MAAAFVQEFALVDGDTSTTNYDAVATEIGRTAPEGLIVHTAGFDHDRGVFRIMDVWESREAGQRFMDEGQDSMDELYDVVARSVQRQQDQTAYIIYDDATAQDKAWQKAVSRDMTTPSYQADTIAELAALLDLDPSTLEETVRSFNEATSGDQSGFDPFRTDGQNVSFGAGIHFCIGAPLARIELQTALSTLFKRLPGIRLAGEPRYNNVYHFHGLERLDVTW